MLRIFDKLCYYPIQVFHFKLTFEKKRGYLLYYCFMFFLGNNFTANVIISLSEREVFLIYCLIKKCITYLKDILKNEVFLRSKTTN